MMYEKIKYCFCTFCTHLINMHANNYILKINKCLNKNFWVSNNHFANIGVLRSVVCWRLLRYWRASLVLFVIVCALLSVKKSVIRESARGVTVISQILTFHFLSSSLRVVLILPSAPKLEVLAPILGFLLGMLHNMQKLVKYKHTWRIDIHTLRSVLIGHDVKKVVIFPAYSIAYLLMHLHRIESGKSAIDCFSRICYKK